MVIKIIEKLKVFNIFNWIMFLLVKFIRVLIVEISWVEILNSGFFLLIYFRLGLVVC